MWMVHVGEQRAGTGAMQLSGLMQTRPLKLIPDSQKRVQDNESGFDPHFRYLRY